MGRSQETYSKKENEKKKLQKRKEKQERKEERKASNKGKSFEDMIAYVDENGQLTSTPPDPNKRKVLNLEDIQLGARIETQGGAEVGPRTGVITSFFSAKGYGFLKDKTNNESIFFHINGLLEDVQEQDLVNFETEMGKKGLHAVRVKKV